MKLEIGDMVPTIYKKGDRVRHSVHGLGTIVTNGDFNSGGQLAEISVIFDCCADGIMPEQGWRIVPKRRLTPVVNWGDLEL